jgi:hypothetical protein
MNHASPEIDQLMTAIAQMHKEHGVIINRDSKGHKSTYASLPRVLETIHKMCSGHGLVLTQYSCRVESQHAVETLLYHTPSKQWISSVSLLTLHPEPQSYDQAWGGSSTYHRRYDAMMLLGLFSEDDDTDNDGEQSGHNGNLSVKQMGLLRYKLQGNKEKEQIIMQRLGITRLEDIPWKKFNEVIEYLNK